MCDPPPRREKSAVRMLGIRRRRLVVVGHREQVLSIHVRRDSSFAGKVCTNGNTCRQDRRRTTRATDKITRVVIKMGNGRDGVFLPSRTSPNLTVHTDMGLQKAVGTRERLLTTHHVRAYPFAPTYACCVIPPVYIIVPSQCRSFFL